MDTLERIKWLMEERGWTAYQLAKRSELPQSTLSNLFKRSTIPSIPTLERICGGLGITLGQFFAEGELTELTKEQGELFRDWALLDAEDKLLVQQLVKALKRKK